MKLAVDTNIFVDAEGVNGPAQALSARKLIADLPVGGTVVPIQVMGELFNVLTRKGQFSPQKAVSVVAELRAIFRTADTTSAGMVAALELAEQHGLNIWDAIILSVSASAGCRLLLSEDMQHGFEWRGVTIINPSFHSRILCCCGHWPADNAADIMRPASPFVTSARIFVMERRRRLRLPVSMRMSRG